MAAVFRKPPRLGTKPIYLPNFTLTLLRTPQQPPNFASFIVPLNLNKLDLRDYLWNAYGVRVRSVRSYIQQQRVQQDKPGAKRPSPRKWYRPRAIKKMLVEMDDPFVWAPEPEDFTKWDKKTYDAAQEHREKENKGRQRNAPMEPSGERENIAEQAQRMLKGEEKWAPTRRVDEWENDGEAYEVEQDVEIVDGEIPARLEKKEEVKKIEE